MNASHRYWEGQITLCGARDVLAIDASRSPALAASILYCIIQRLPMAYRFPCRQMAIWTACMLSTWTASCGSACARRMQPGARSYAISALHQLWSGRDLPDSLASYSTMHISVYCLTSDTAQELELQDRDRCPAAALMLSRPLHILLQAPQLFKSHVYHHPVHSTAQDWQSIYQVAPWPTKFEGPAGKALYGKQSTAASMVRV